MASICRSSVALLWRSVTVRRFGSLIEYVRNEYDTDGRVFNIGGEDAEAGEDTKERVLQ